MFEQVKEALSQFVSVKDAVHSLREIVGIVQVDHAQMAESLSGVRIEIKDIVAAVVAEVLKRLTPELDAMHGARTVGTKRAGTEKSNSAHFNGEKKIESKGGNSEDSSCMFLYSNKVNGQRIQNDQVCLVVTKDFICYRFLSVCNCKHNTIFCYFIRKLHCRRSR